MSGILETILGAGGGGAVEQLSSQFGLSGNQTQAAIKSLLPALTQGLQKNLAKPQGAEGLLAALQGGSHQRYIEQPRLVTQAAGVADGNKILGHVLGSKDASRAAAASASQASGIDTGILKKMLPMLATLAMGAMSKKTSGLDLSSVTGGDSGGGGGGLLGAAMGALGGNKGSSGGLASMLGGLLGGGGGKDDDGFGLDDVMGLAGKLF